MIAVGLAAGLVTAVAVGRVLESQLFGVQPGELRVLVLASLAVAFAGAVAVWWPARRAAATDPAAALRAE
jgi:ABC-type antimicrobial peptide transport system permease subunit